ncbi:hypothetical protein [uncultured Flavobacterium sp.]|uniref:hypothetical protein n=1 Tax=uncultured Flavobacterium sp. TaxID=165435 RepID=UPI0025EE8B07|nr:hypothetical protein [uncultured Flavobacterium sp.]
MNRTWTSGSIELLRHANDHIQLDTAFDKRIAFISIDNAVEIMIKTFLSLPKHFFGNERPSRKELDDCNNSFSNYLILLIKYATNKLVGIELGDIEHYHRIRNTLYHDGTGLAVDQEYLSAYNTLANLLLKRLFDVNIEYKIDNSSLEKIITNWNLIEEYLTEILEPGLVYSGIYLWDEAILSGLITSELAEEIMELKALRNKEVHSKSIDNSTLGSTYKKSLEVVENLRTHVESSRKTLRDRNFYYEPMHSEIIGTLVLDHFFGPPGYGETPEMDRVESAWVLELEAPINVIQNNSELEEGNSNYSKFNIDRVQLSGHGSGIDMQFFKNKKVNASGILWGAYSGHHYAPILMTLQQITQNEGIKFPRK